MGSEKLDAKPDTRPLDNKKNDAPPHTSKRPNAPGKNRGGFFVESGFSH
jgi:hypothetical protein